MFIENGQALPRIARAEIARQLGVDHAFNVFWDRVLNLRHRVPTPLAFRSVEEWVPIFLENGLETTYTETYRPKWPTLMTYHHTLFVLDREQE